MNLDAINKWLPLLANFGVIGGLVFVALQMNFNTETIRLQNGPSPMQTRCFTQPT